MSDDGWTSEENKLFENAVAEFEPVGSSAFFQHVALLMPWKSINSIQRHYQAFIDDQKLIEASDGKSEKQKTTRRPRARAIPWTRDEHR